MEDNVMLGRMNGARRGRRLDTHETPEIERDGGAATAVARSRMLLDASSIRKSA